MKSNIIISDLDGTLLDENRKISQANLEAIQKIVSEGHHFIIATGRSRAASEEHIKSLADIGVDDYKVTYNGAYIESPSGEVLSDFSLNKDEIDKLISIAEDSGYTLQLYWDGSLYVKELNDYVRAYLENSKSPCIEGSAYKELEHSHKALFNSSPDSKFDEFEKYLDKSFPTLSVFRSAPEYIELIRKGKDKGNALSLIAEYLGIDIADCVAIGDSFNDISMIESAGIGIAVANACDELKNKASYICERTHRDSVMIELYDKFLSK